MLLKIIYKIIRPSISGFNWYIENKYKCTVTIEFKFEFKNLKGREKRKYKKGEENLIWAASLKFGPPRHSFTHAGQLPVHHARTRFFLVDGWVPHVSTIIAHSATLGARLGMLCLAVDMGPHARVPLSGSARSSLADSRAPQAKPLSSC